MKQIINLSLLVLVTLTCLSCSKKTNCEMAATAEYLIVGNTGGFIMPTSKTSYFIVIDSTLKEDTSLTIGTVPAAYSGFNFNYLLPQSLYDSVGAGVLSSIPAELLTNNGAFIGTVRPDVGYTDLRVSISGASYNWKFSPDQSTSSIAVQTFVQKINKILN